MPFIFLWGNSHLKFLDVGFALHKKQPTNQTTHTRTSSYFTSGSQICSSQEDLDCPHSPVPHGQQCCHTAGPSHQRPNPDTPSILQKTKFQPKSGQVLQWQWELRSWFQHIQSHPVMHLPRQHIKDNTFGGGWRMLSFSVWAWSKLMLIMQTNLFLFVKPRPEANFVFKDLLQSRKPGSIHRDLIRFGSSLQALSKSAQWIFGQELGQVLCV